MGRPKRIARDALLDTAEDIVRARGVSALTIEALATALGVTKGGVQYTFKSKGDLISAMLERWMAQYEMIFEEVAAQRTDPEATMEANLEATRRADAMLSAKSAALLAALMQTEHLATTRKEYRQYMDHWSGDDEAGRTRRLKFLAAEGAFFLRSFGLLNISEPEWDSIFADIRRLSV